MQYSQLIYWFLSYSILIAGTAIAASALMSLKERRFRVILLVDISLLIMVLAVSFILFLFQKSTLSETENNYYFLELLFFFGIASSAYFILDLPAAILNEPQKVDRRFFLSISIVTGILSYIVFFSVYYFIYPQKTVFIILTGISQLLIFLLFSISSIKVIVIFFKSWHGWSWLIRLIRLIILIISIMFVLSIFTVDIIYGLYFKIHNNRELNLFYILPLYSIVVCSILTIFVLKNVSFRKGRVRKLNSVKLKACGISQRELEVVLCLVEGKSYKKIADELCISLATVQSHIRSIYRKLDINSKIELINFCSD